MTKKKVPLKKAARKYEWRASDVVVVGAKDAWASNPARKA